MHVEWQTTALVFACEGCPHVEFCGSARTVSEEHTSNAIFEDNCGDPVYMDNVERRVARLVVLRGGVRGASEQTEPGNDQPSRHVHT